MEDITDADYMYASRICQDFEIKNLGEYHHLDLKSETLILANFFQIFRKMCLKVYHLGPVKFLSAPELAWQAALKKTEIKLELLKDTDMLLMVEKALEEKYVMQFIDIQKLINNIWKIMIKTRNLHMLNMGN